MKKLGLFILSVLMLVGCSSNTIKVNQVNNGFEYTRIDRIPDTIGVAIGVEECESETGYCVKYGFDEDEKIPNVVSTAINVIKIVVPILLVIFGMLDLMKGVTASKEDEIKKGQQIFIKRLISGALVFFVFTIVQLIVSFVADKSDKDNIATCSSCFLTGDCTYKKNSSGSCPAGTKLNTKKTTCIKK